MSQLVFNYGTMNSSKTANLLMTAHTLRVQGKRVTLIKPLADTRDGKSMIQSRVGLEAMADIVLHPNNYPLEKGALPQNEKKCGVYHPTVAIIKGYQEKLSSSDIILVDEAQFLSPVNVEMLRSMSKPVQCYGLLTDYRSLLFPGSKRLVELADQIKEITYDVSPFLGNCSGCKGNKAIINSKFTVISTGIEQTIKTGSSEPDLGAEEKYKPLCWGCWLK